jgi:hypothetical protein
MKKSKLLVADIRPICANIEAVASQYFYPTVTGFWISGMDYPVIEEGRKYFIDKGQEQSANIQQAEALFRHGVRADNVVFLSPAQASRLGVPVFIDDPKQITGDVYNLNFELILQRGQAKFLHADPSHPPVIAQLVKECIQQLLDEFSTWRDPKVRRPRAVSSKISFARTITQYLQPQFRTDENIAVIEDQLLDLAKRVIDFIGDDGWIMHFVDRRGSRLTVEKTIDYRIFDWMRTHNLSDED